MKRYVLAAVLAVSVFGATAMIGNTAEAKRPPSVQVEATISINETDVALGDWVTFRTTNVTSRSPRIQVMCYQGGALVYGMALAASEAFELGGGSSDWRTNGGEADCVATLYEWDWRPVQTFVPYATVSFHAGGR